MGDPELRNEMHCSIKFCYRLDKTVAETVKLMKETYKCFGEPYNIRWFSDFQKRRLTAELASKPKQRDSVVNDRNINTVRAILQENRGINV